MGRMGICTCLNHIASPLSVGLAKETLVSLPASQRMPARPGLCCVAYGWGAVPHGMHGGTGHFSFCFLRTRHCNPFSHMHHHRHRWRSLRAMPPLASPNNAAGMHACAAGRAASIWALWHAFKASGAYAIAQLWWGWGWRGDGGGAHGGGRHGAQCIPPTMPRLWQGVITYAVLAGCSHAVSTATAAAPFAPCHVSACMPLAYTLWQSHGHACLSANIA